MNKATVPKITPERVRGERMVRFNPLTSISPANLARQLELFAQGHIADVARTWDAIAHRDDKLPALIGKRLGALARYGYEIATVEKSPVAEAHREALEYFFNNLTAVNAVDENERGGFKLLVRQIGSAILHRYSAHEILWQPKQVAGAWQMTAELRHAPLWFFENKTGKLRFLKSYGAIDGEAMEPDQWLVAAGAGLMEACSVLYMFKRLPLGDWLNYCEGFGMPGVVGHTTSAKDSDTGNAMATAVEAIGAQLAFVIYGAQENKIELLRDSGAGSNPFDPLVEYCNRGLSILLRGADLSTMSAGSGEGSGASLQGSESDVLEQDDAEWVSEILQEKLARRVIEWKFGAGTQPLAYIKIKTKQTPDTNLDLTIMEKLVALGMPVSQQWASERFGVPIAEESEPILTGRAVTPPPFTAANDRTPDAKGTARYLKAAKARVAGAVSKDLAPLAQALRAIINAPDADLQSRIASFQANGAGILAAINKGGATEKALAEALGTAALDGLSTTQTDIQ